jgi:hypothetical protein
VGTNEFHVRVLDSLSKRDATGISWRWVAREVDHGRLIDARSLRLTADRQSITWTNSGTSRSATIR